MQRVDRHVVERPTAGLAVVPGRIDVGENILTLADLLVLMVPTESRATGCPADRANSAVGDKLFDLLIMRAQHLAGRCHDLKIPRMSEIDQFSRLCACRGHGLVEVDMLTGFERLSAQCIVQTDRRGNRHRIYAAFRQKIGIIGKSPLYAQFGRRCLRTTGDRIAYRGETDAVLQIRLAQMRQDTRQRDGAGAHDTDSNDISHLVCLLRLLHRLDYRDKGMVYATSW